ncbi:MAG TPA: GAF domain-containing protein [Balneolaceae bacterium]
MTHSKKDILADSESYRKFFDSMDRGFCIIQVLFDDDEKPVDYRFLQANSSFAKQTGLKDVEGKRMLDLEPEHEKHWFEVYGRVALTGKSERFEHHAEKLGNRWYEVYADSFGPVENRQVAILFSDITKRKQAEEVMCESEEHKSFLLQLTDALRNLTDPNAVLSTAAETLGRHIEAQQVAYAEIDETVEFAIIEKDWNDGSMPSNVGWHRLEDFGGDFVDDLKNGEAIVIDDVRNDERTSSPETLATFSSASIAALINIPLVKNDKLVAVLAIHSSRVRDWRPEEAAIAEEIAELTWASVERVRAEVTLQGALEYNKAILRTSPVPLLVLESDLRVATANRAFYRQFKGDREQTVGCLIYELGNGQWNIPKLRQLLEEILPLHNTMEQFEVTHKFETIGRRTMLLNARRMRGEKGAPNRIVLVIEDITERKRSEANAAFLNEVSQDMTNFTNIDETMEVLGKKIAGYFGLSACTFAEIDENEIGVIGQTRHVAAMPGTYRMEEFVSPEVLQRCRAGKPVIIRDVKTDPLTDTGQYAALNIGSFASMPLVRDGEWRFLFVVYRSEPYDWREDEIELIRELANRIWTRLERARVEETLRKSEEKQWFLVKLTDALRNHTGPNAILSIAAKTLGGQLEAEQVAYGDIDEAEEFIIIEKDWNNGSMPSNAGRHRLEDFGGGFIDDLKNGKTVVIEDVHSDERTSSPEALATFSNASIAALINVPLIKNGKLVAILAVHNSTVHDWQPKEVAIAEETAERTWAAVERARAEEALRESEERYRNLFESIDEGYCIIEMLFDDDDKPVDYRFLEVNHAFKKQTGYKDAVGRRILELNPEQESYWFEIYGRVAVTGEPERFKNEVKAIGRWFDVYAFRIADPEKRQVAILFNDITEQKRREERKEFLLELSDALRAEPNADAMENRTLRMLYEQMGFDRCYIGVYQLEEDRGIFTRQVGNDKVPPVPDEVRLSDFPDALRVALDRTLVINDVSEAEVLSDTDRQNLSALGMGALVASSLRRGENNPIWSIVAISGRPRQWTRDEIALMEEVTERTWAAMERARVEEALRERKEHFRLATEVARLGTWQYDLETSTVHFDEQMRNIWGIGSPELSLSFTEVVKRIHPDNRQRVIRAIEAALNPANANDEYSVEYSVIGDDGKVRWIAANGQAQFSEGEARKPVHFFGTARDVTRRKQTMNNLRESEERLQIALKTGKLGSWELNIAHNYHLTASDTCKANFGLSPGDELTYERLAEMIIPEDRERWQKEVTQAIEQQLDFNTEYAIHWPNGEKHWILARGRAFYNSDGVPVKMIGVTLNITDQKRHEEELMTLKDRLDADLSTMTRLHELSLRLTSTADLQPMLEEILNSAIELQNADFGSLQLYDEESDSLELYAYKGFGQEFEEVFKNVKGTDTVCGSSFEEGRQIIIEDIRTDFPDESMHDKAYKFGFQAVQSTPLFNRSGNVIGMLSTHFKEPHRPTERELRVTDLYAHQAADMIDLKLTEERLRASEEKLQSLNETLEERVEKRTSSLLSYQNQLRSLVAQLSNAEEQERHRLASDLHDNLGQILAVIKMNIDLLKKGEEDAEIAGISALVDDAITYTRQLMSDLKPPPSLDDEDLKTAVGWVARKMKKHDLDVSVEDDGEPKPLSEEVRSTLLRSVREMLFNVVKHAGVNRAHVELSRTGDQVRAIVEDKGEGFDVEESRSTESLEGGFGLFNISERINLLEGDLEIESEPGKGTKATVLLPVLKSEEEMTEAETTAENVASDKSDKSQKQVQGSRKIKVLLADDHQIMREGLRKIINEEKDLTVTGEASNGKEAIEMAIETHPDVIVMDVNMPEMNGIQATQKIKAELPDIQIIALSFHDSEDVAREMRDVGASAYLTKSDAFETLCATIRSEAVGVVNDKL